MEQVIRLTSINHLIGKWWRGLVTCLIVGLVLAGAVTWFIMPTKYGANVQVLVNQRTKSATAQYTNQQTNVQLIATYKELLLNSAILKPTQRALSAAGVQRSQTTLKRELNVTNSENSQVFTITVRDRNAQGSALIANQLAQTFKQRIRRLINLNNVTIVSPARVPVHPVSPQLGANLGIGALLGVIVGLGYAMVRELTDYRVHTTDFLTDDLELTDLGTIQHQAIRQTGTTRS